MNTVFNIEKAQLYWSALQYAGDIMFLLSTTGNIMHFNKAALNSYGYTEKELLSMNIFNLRNHSEISLAHNQFEKAKSEGVLFISKHFRKGGSSFPVEVKSISIDVNGETFILSIIRDITDRLKKQKEIQHLAYIVENSEDAIISKTLDGIITSWNKGAEKIFGYNEYEILDKNVSVLVPKEKINEIEIRMNKLIKDGTVEHYEALVKKKNNQLITISVSLSPIYDLEENLIGVSIIARDITKQMEYIKTIETISNALDNSSSGVLITDISGNLEYVNKKFESITGYKKQEVIGHNIKILNSGLQNEKFYKKMWESIINGHDWSGKFCNKKKDGSVFWWSASISTIKDEKGKIVKFLSVTEDITDKKRLTEEIFEKNKQLENTLKLLKETQMQLIQEDKMASVGQLSAGIAHEINNPLGFVSSNFNTLKKYVDNLKNYIVECKKVRDSLSSYEIESISNEIMKLSKLEEKNKLEYILNDLEDLYKDTEDGLNRIKKIVLTLRNFAHESNNNSFENYDLNQGIEDTLIIAKNELKYNTTVKCNSLDGLPFIQAKTSEINQVLLNVIINSSHAIKEKNNNNPDFMGKIFIDTWKDDKYVYCSIKDNGIGIPEENFSKLFNPFFTTKPLGKGTGLGLSISYDIIVNKHKGNITLESKFGEGTKTIITLPISQGGCE